MQKPIDSWIDGHTIWIFLACMKFEEKTKQKNSLFIFQSLLVNIVHFMHKHMECVGRLCGNYNHTQII